MPEAPEKAAPTAPVVVGDVVAGKYEILRPLGSGGMGMVFQAAHVSLGQKVAIKFLAAGQKDASASDRFTREAHISAELTAEQVARVIDLGALPDGSSYIVMEFLEGQDLDALLEERGCLPHVEAVDYILQACVAIAEAHSLGVVHRDIKPGNLFLSHRADGSPLVKVLDFGISKRIEGADTRITQTGSSFGSPLYMSPEQLRDSKNVDPRSDIWALGMVLYELIAGRAAFESETLHETVSKIAADEAVPLHVLVPEVPEGLAAVIATCLAKKREERPQDVAELARALAPFASEGAAGTYLTRVCGSLERIPASGPASSRMRIPAAAQPEKAVPAPSSGFVGSRTTMRPPPGRTRRAALISVAVILLVGAAIAIAFVVRRTDVRPSPPVLAASIPPRPPDPAEPAASAIAIQPVPVATVASARDAGSAEKPGSPAAHPHPPAPSPGPGPRQMRPRTPSVNDDPFKTR